MTKRSSNGWSDIVELDDGPPERTVVDPMPFPDATPVDARPGLVAEPRRQLRIPMPGERAAPAAMPLAEDLEVPAAHPAPTAPTPRAPRAPRTDAAFSGEAFIDALGPGVTAATKPAAPHSWREYRELIVTVSVGLVLLCGAIAWRVSGGPSAPPVLGASASPTAQAPSPPPTVVPAQAAERATAPTPSAAVDPALGAEAEPEAPTIVRSAIPILSVVTVPPGAEIEIGGEFVGRSPFISTAPQGTTQLRVVATKEGFEAAETTVMPNESGHLSTTLVLIPLQPGSPRRPRR